MRPAVLHAEWTKLRTAPGNGWLLLATIGLTDASLRLASLADAMPAREAGARTSSNR